MSRDGLLVTSDPLTNLGITITSCAGGLDLTTVTGVTLDVMPPPESGLPESVAVSTTYVASAPTLATASFTFAAVAPAPYAGTYQLRPYGTVSASPTVAFTLVFMPVAPEFCP
jgi:hypothetical protein